MHPAPRTVRPGFTLVELLLVIAIIGILMFITILAINPAHHLSQARNAQRREDVNTIINAIYQYAIDKNGVPSVIPSGTFKPICRTGTGYVTCNAGGSAVRLEMLSGTYIVSLPIDPLVAKTATGYTGYVVSRDVNDRVTVNAPNAELQEAILVTR